MGRQNTGRRRQDAGDRREGETGIREAARDADAAGSEENCEEGIALGRLFRTFVVLLVGLFGASTGNESQTDLTCTILYDNTAYVDGVEPDWGFACLVEGAGRTILFDTGRKPEILLGNAAALGADLQAVDVVVISHNHGDHTGGLSAFLERNSKVTAYLPASFPAEFVEKVEATGAKVVLVSEPIEVCDGVHVTGEMGDRVVEQSLILRGAEGSSVITGCSHPGVVEILEQTQKEVEGPVQMVFGGFHLLRDTAEEVDAIIGRCRDIGVRQMGATHCTGEKAIEQFRSAYGAGFLEMGVGRVVRVRRVGVRP